MNYVSPYLERAARRAQIDSMARKMLVRLRQVPDFRSAESVVSPTTLPPSAAGAAGVATFTSWGS